VKVLFVSSGNKRNGVSSIVDMQRKSLIHAGVDVDMFLVNGRGWLSYLRAIYLLRSKLRYQKFDIIHSHYSFSTWVAILAGGRNIVGSLMGSDVKASFFLRILIKVSLLPFCRAIIVKSDEMKRDLSYDDAQVVPNGVNLDVFYPQNSRDCKKVLGWDNQKLNVLFPSNPNRPEKNFGLLENALASSGIKNYVIHTLTDISFSEMPTYYNAADIVCMSSTREGSPNAIKEAMACDKLVVSTNVGDVEWLFGSTSGLFLSDQEVLSFSASFEKALAYGLKNEMCSRGRDRILQLQLSDALVAMKLIEIYKDVTGS